MFQIKDLHVGIADKEIVHGVTLSINPGEVHAIMGPNGSGKSTIANTIMGHPKYSVISGEISIDGENIESLKADKRAQKGIFLAFQYPKEIPGVSVSAFLRSAVAAVRKARGEVLLTPIEFRKLLRAKMTELNLDAKFMARSMNEGFSGGEKKKIEILQMALLEPKIAILDETDSGLDVDALRIVSESINRLATGERGILLITHYQRILHYVKPQFVHIMINGKIVKSGGHDLARKVEDEGYDWIRKELGILDEADDGGDDQANKSLRSERLQEETSEDHASEGSTPSERSKSLFAKDSFAK